MLMPQDLRDKLHCTARQTNYVGTIEDDWTSVLVRLGANEQLIHAIVHSDMEDMMMCNTAWEWVKEAMYDRSFTKE